MKNNQLYKLHNNTLITPPFIGTRHNGRTVTGYNKLAIHKLMEDGWKPLIENARPEDVEGYEIVSYYEEDKSAIYLKWALIKLPEPEPEPTLNEDDFEPNPNEDESEVEDESEDEYEYEPDESNT